MEDAGEDRSLRPLFEPRAVAIIGASSKKGKIGYEILRNMIEGQFKEPIYPINPHEETILGLKAYQSVAEVPSVVDLCVITVSPSLVPQVLHECGDRKVRGAAIISAGYSEIGNFELEKRVVEEASKNGIRVIGPNCAGIINTEKRLFATIESRIAPGCVAFITQSGAFGGAALAWARQERIGFSKFISYGNRCDVDEADLLDYLLQDRQTKVIVAYIEGLRDGRRFVETAKRVSARKPILAVKSGYSSEGMRATLSHTGAMAGSDSICDAAFRQVGIIRAEDIDDLFDMAKALSTQPLPNGDRMLVVTNSGGPGVMMVDALAKCGLKVPEPSNEMKDRFNFLPEICSKKNPIDLTAQGGPDDYKKVIEVARDSGDFDVLITLFVPPAYMKSEPTSEAVLEASKVVSKPVLACWMSGDLVRDGVERLEGGGVPNFPTPKRAAKAAWALVQRGRYLIQQETQEASKRF